MSLKILLGWHLLASVHLASDEFVSLSWSCSSCVWPRVIKPLISEVSTCRSLSRDRTVTCPFGRSPNQRLQWSLNFGSLSASEASSGSTATCSERVSLARWACSSDSSSLALSRRRTACSLRQRLASCRGSWAFLHWYCLRHPLIGHQSLRFAAWWTWGSRAGLSLRFQTLQCI